MLVQINPQSSTPVYLQIAASIRGAILRGDVVQGERLPGARELAQSLDLNMHTVLHAYGELRDEGLVDIRRGRGVTVLAPQTDLTEVTAALTEFCTRARAAGLSDEGILALVKGALA